MEGKEWFNLRQICRSRFSPTRNDSKLNFFSCRKGVRMFCGRVGVVGVVGAALVLLGVTQVVAGCYYMLALPIFQLGSNIWTGSWSIVCGAAVATIAWTNRTMRRGHVILVATISVLVANVANLVILQVGENEDLKLIVESNLDDAMKIAFWLTTVVTALSIVVSFFGAQYLFCVVVRGPRLKGGIPVTRSLSEQDLHHRQDCQDSSPSLEDVVALPDPAGSSAWVYHPEDDKTVTPLYPLGLDLLSDFPDGSRKLPARHASFVTPRYARVHQRPQRAQSFAVRRDLQTLEGQLRPPPPVTLPEVTNARISHYARPIARRIHRSNSVSGRLLLEGNSGGATLSRRFHVSSLDDLDAPIIEVGTLSKERSKSDQSLSSILNGPSTDQGVMEYVHRSASVQERLLDSKKVLTSFGPVSRPVARITKPKGPAPPPPIKSKPILPPPPVLENAPKTETTETDSPSIAASTVSTKEETHRKDSTPVSNDENQLEPIRLPEAVTRESRQGSSISKRVSALEHHLPLPVIEENIKNTRKRPAPQPRTILPQQCDDEMPREISSMQMANTQKAAPPEVVKPPRPSLKEKPPHLAERGITLARPVPVKKPERKRSDGDNVANLRKLEQVLTNILDRGATAPLRATKSDENIMESLKALDNKVPKSILKKGPNKPSKYEVAHREALEDSKALLEQLPHGELQRNKIVLRVPSFRTAGCQTETYRPVRRRASCAQTNLSVAPRYKETLVSNNNTKTLPQTSPTERWIKPGHDDDSQETSIAESSSSSGYSSPEVSSKDPSPTHSGPPSPASSSTISDEDERRGDTNVTVIEINKNVTAPPKLPPWHGLDPMPPPRPPKPLRLRPMSDAAALVGSQGGLLVPVHRRASQIPLYEDVFGLAALTENVMLLTEAINPVLVQTMRDSENAGDDLLPSTTPRVVEMIRKNVHSQSQDDKWDGRTTFIPRPKSALRTHSLTLPRPSYIPTPQPRQSQTSKLPSSLRHADQSQQTEQNPSSSTAAYLASLELLASHYRHQALANAKQLQLQQRLLAQQQKQQKSQQKEPTIKKSEDENNTQPQQIQEKTRVSQRQSQVSGKASKIPSPIKTESEC